jgi:5-formyltetrahydrofolate cyclo-ligase
MGGPDDRRSARPAEAKRSLRTALSTARKNRPAAARAAGDAALTEVLIAAIGELGARTVACYAPVGTEPGGPALPSRLLAAGLAVLLPVLLADGDLDWAEHRGPLVGAARGLREPATGRLGLDAVTWADLVVVPALAVDLAGTRLGRGGGSYDRALARVPAGRPVVALLHPGELLRTRALPAEPHDRPVGAALTADDGWLDLPITSAAR